MTEPRKLIIAFLVLGLAVLAPPVEAGWNAQTSGTSVVLRDVHFPVDTSTGWVVGDSGTILKTTNGGATWVSQTSPTGVSLINVHFPVDANTGYIVGFSGTILKTTNGGTTWTAQSSGTTQNLLGLDFPVDAATGYAAGVDGTILKTTNGGTTWTTQSSGTSAGFRRMDFPVDATTGWVVGTDGTILKTLNGGSSWSGQSSGITNTLLGVDFPVGTSIGYVVGNGGTVLKTTTGGSSWGAIPPVPASGVLAVDFVSNNIGYIAGGNGEIHKTTNGGTSWVLQSSGTSYSLRGLQFPIDSQTGYACGQNGTILKTTDGGASASQGISGTVYTDEGTTNAGAAHTVRLVVNGVDVGNDVTDASGAYSITASVNSSDAMLVFIDQSIDGMAVTVSDGANLAGLDIYQDHVITRHDNGGSLSIADMDGALGSFSDNDITYSVTAGALTVDNADELYVPAGHTFAPGGNVTTGHLKILGTIDAGANTFSIEENWDAASGTFNAGASTVTFVGSADSTFIPGASTYGSLDINKGNISRVVTISSGPLTLAAASSLAITTGIFDLAGNNLDIGAGSSFSNDATLRLEGGETVTNLVNDTDSGSVIYNGGSSYAGLAAGDNYYLLTFGNAAGTWTLDNNLDVNSNLNLTNGTLDVSASNYSINVAGDFTKIGVANFVPRSGTVTLDGSNQRIGGNPTFFNLVKTVASPDTLTFTESLTTTVNGTATLQGASGALLSLRSFIPGSSFLFTLSAGATKDISFVDVQDSDASGSDAALTPIDPANSVNSGNTVAWFSPTITLSKSADVATAKPGDTITYTLTYGNSSAGDATNLVITDTIPANTTLVPASITGGGTESGGVITWNLGPLAAGQVNRTVDFAVTVDAGVLAGVVIDNDATANFDDSGGTPQTLVTSNTANVNVAQVGGVSVQPDQSGTVGSATGNQLSYTFTVTNTGNGNDHFDLGILKSGPDFWIGELYDATGTVLMAQDADADGTWDFVNPAVDFDADGQPDTGTMAAGATLDVILRLTVPAGTTPGDRDITSLTATSNFDDGFGLATATSVAVSGADTPEISFTKGDTPDPVLSNDTLSYAFTYENTGTKIATGVFIVDSIPAGAAFVSSSAFGETGVAIEFSTNNRGTWGAEPADPTTVTDIRWIVGNLNKNRGSQVTGFDVQPDIALPDGSILVNSATLSSNELPDITATASTTVRSAVAFTNSTKTVTPTLTSPGATLLYTIFVTNSGAVAGTNVVVTDLLPLETSYVPGSITGAGADDSGAPTLTWNLGVIPAGTTIGPLTYQVIVNNPVAADTFFIQNTATIDSNETLSANTTTATTVLTAAPLFSGSTKTSQDLNAGSLLVGDTIEYRVDVINTGDMNATGVIVTDIVPADTTYVPGSITGLGADDSAAPNLTWNIGNLAVGVPSVATFRVTVNGGVPIGTQISNLAQIASDQTAAVSTPPVVNTVGGGTTGSIQSTSPIVPGANVLIRITDADLNTDIATLQSFSETTTNTVTGETELLVYTETGPNTGTFEATVLTVFGIAAGTNDDGVFNVQAGDTLETTYNDVLTSSGAPGSATATTIVTGGGSTGTLVSTTPINPGDIVTLTLTDADLDVDPGVAETTSVTTVNSVTGESETLLYTETGVNTAVFSANVATVFGIVAGTDNDGTFNVQAGDSLVSIYNDALTVSGGPGVAVATTDVLSAGVSGTISSTPTISPSDVVTFTLTDADLDTDPGVAETIILSTTNSVTGESEALIYTETGVNTGVFTATVATVFGIAAGTDDDGTFNVQTGDSLATTYNDAISDTGGPATDIATTNVVLGSAELTVLKSVVTVRDPLGAVAPAALAIPGGTVEYEVSVTNSGNANATEVIITDTLNSNLTFLAGDFDGGAADIEIIVGAAAPVYCIAEVGGDTNTDGCFLSAGGDDLTVTIPVSASYPTGLTVGTTAPDNVVVVHFRATVN